MKLRQALDVRISQAEFADLVGISEAAVSQLKAGGAIEPDGTALAWLHAYLERLREVAAGRTLELSHERALLAREQRLGLEIKNAALRGEYASVKLLAEVLATASQAVAERFDHLPGALRKVLPDMDEAARDQVLGVVADARNEWVRATSELVAARLTELEDDDADDDNLVQFDESPV